MLILAVPASLFTNVTTNIAKRVYLRDGGDRGIKTDMLDMLNINSIQFAFVVFLIPKIKQLRHDL